MAKQLAQELRKFMEQTNERFKSTNKMILEAIQKLSNNNQTERPNPNSRRNAHSNHSENVLSTEDSVFQDTLPLFLPSKEPTIEEEPTTNSVEEIAQIYTRLDPQVRNLISFKECYETKLLESKKGNLYK